jgi:hypothetical protein
MTIPPNKTTILYNSVDMVFCIGESIIPMSLVRREVSFPLVVPSKNATSVRVCVCVSK